MTARPDHGGIVLYLAAILLFQSTNVFAKYLMQHYPILEVVWARFLFNFLVFLPLFLTPAFRGYMRPVVLRHQLARSGLLYGTNMVFLAGLSILPLATAASIMFVGPMFLVTLSALVLSERVGPRRWAAVVIGFAGVVVILRPGLSFTWASLLPLGAAFMYSCYQIVTRRISAAEPVPTIFFFTPMVGAVCSSVVAVFVWKTPTPEGWALMVSMGAVAGSGQYFLIKAFERSQASLLAPFGYSSLIWATFFGFVVFGDLPDHWTIAGAAVVIGAGLYIWHRERALGRYPSLS
jgi:drug/metabolite transporter (DMT)-like permease